MQRYVRLLLISLISLILSFGLVLTPSLAATQQTQAGETLTTTQVAKTSSNKATKIYVKPYIGLSLGNDTTKLDADYVDNGLNANYGLNGTSYGIYGGLNFTPFQNKISVGLEGFAENIWNATASDSGVATPAPTFKKLDNVGFSLLPSVAITENNTVFVRLGVVRSKFNYQNTLVGGFNYTSHGTGFQYGIGTLYNLWKHVGLRAEYDLVNYGQLNYSRAGSALNENLNYTSNEFKIGLQWTF